MGVYERQTATRSAIRRGVREVPILEESRRHRRLPPIRSNLHRICHLWAMADNEVYRLVRAVEGEGMSGMDANQISFVAGTIFGVALSTALYAYHTSRVNK